MQKTQCLLMFIIIIFGNCRVNAMELELPQKPSSQTHLVIVPGQNGAGGQNAIEVLSYFSQRNNLVHYVETPLSLPDFGQDRCQSLLRNKINSLKEQNIIGKNDFIIGHASSQGTATLLNHTAHYPENIKALILESILLTGNSAIFHTVDNTMLPEGSHLPDISYYTLPCVAKSSFPAYSPGGEQPINNIDKLSTNLPIIILHDTKDFQLSFKDAQALYAYLTTVKGNKNVYLFAQESLYGKHINLLKPRNTEEISAINSILKHYGLLPSDDRENSKTIEELQQVYQPIPQQEWLDHFYAIFKKEQNIACLESSAKITSAGIGLYAITNWLGITK